MIKQKSVKCSVFISMFFLLFLAMFNAYGEDLYIISYDGNGLQLPSNYSEQIKTAGQNIRILPNMPETTPDKLQAFLGWALSPDATLPDYYPNDWYSADADATLYAIWDDPSDLGIINGNLELSKAPVSRIATHQWFSFSVSESGKYYFVTNLENASSSKNGIYSNPVQNIYTPDIFSPSQRSPVSFSTMLEAGVDYYLCLYVPGNKSWSLQIGTSLNNAYIVSYNGNGIQLSSYFREQIKTAGQNIRILTSIPETTPNKLQSFIGWALSPDATVPDYYPDGIYTADADATLYAIWDDPSDLGIINGNLELSKAPVSRIATHQWFSFSVSKSGKYYFVTNLENASSSKNGIYSNPVQNIYTPDIFSPSQRSPVSFSTVLEAGVDYYLCLYVPGNISWSLQIGTSLNNAYIVSYNGNGIQLSSYFREQIKTAGQNIRILTSIPETTPSKLQSFIGWALQPDAAVPDYYPDGIYTTDANATLYAIWDDPSDLGIINGNLELSKAAVSKISTHQWFSFSVSESGKYYFVTDLENAFSSKNGIYSNPVQNIYTPDIFSPSQGSPVSFSTVLEAGVDYYLCLYVPGNKSWNMVVSDSVDCHIHSWIVSSYTWSNDRSTVTASKTCSKCGSSETETVPAYKVAVNPPTLDQAGSYQIISSSFNDNTFEVQVSVDDSFIIPALGSINVFTLPDSLTRIEEDAFSDTLAEAVIIPDGCLAIDPGIFSECDKLIFVSVPEGLSFDDNAFSNKVIIQYR